jgi:2-polyprenyl-3-methyl-5-hydroxy-6-metoxy-1,4-benzoquinol methylase
MSSILKKALFIIESDAFKGLEKESALRIGRRLAGDRDDKSLDLYELPEDHLLGICHVCDYQHYDILIFVCGNVFIKRESIQALAEIAYRRADLAAIVPVTNLSQMGHQVEAPSFPYHTLLQLREAVREVWDRHEESVVAVEEIDDFCLAIRPEVIAGLPKATPLPRLPQIIGKVGLTYGVARGVYVHRYGDLYESAREDLLAHVPTDARDILDIGCAAGLFGEMLKNRQECTVTGVEWDLELVRKARQRLDAVFHGDIEEMIDRGALREFDCIVCGDVLEHLNNPWKVVKGLRRHLKKGGLFVASVPNIANWWILNEMLKGRWDYVPFTTLSGTHIRFFTRETLKECFEDAGYRIENLYFQSFLSPPAGAAFMDMLKKGFANVREEELKASEIVIVAANERMPARFGRHRY